MADDLLAVNIWEIWQNASNLKRISDLQKRESNKEIEEFCNREPHTCYFSPNVIRLTVLRNIEWDMCEDCETLGLYSACCTVNQNRTDRWHNGTWRLATQWHREDLSSRKISDPKLKMFFFANYSLEYTHWSAHSICLEISILTQRTEDVKEFACLP